MIKQSYNNDINIYIYNNDIMYILYSHALTIKYCAMEQPLQGGRALWQAAQVIDGHDAWSCCPGIRSWEHRETCHEMAMY